MKCHDRNKSGREKEVGDNLKQQPIRLSIFKEEYFINGRKINEREIKVLRLNLIVEERKILKERERERDYGEEIEIKIEVGEIYGRVREATLFRLKQCTPWSFIYLSVISPMVYISVACRTRAHAQVAAPQRVLYHVEIGPFDFGGLINIS